MIVVQDEALAVTKSIGLGSTLRYISSMRREGFRTVDYWRGRGLAWENHCGQGRGEYNAACVPVTAQWEGDATRLVLQMSLYCTNSRERTFRWAVTTERMDRIATGTGPAPQDPRILGRGKITCQEYGGRTHTETHSLKVSSLPGTFYVYLWRNSTAYGNVHIYDFTVRVYSRSGAMRWWNADIYIADENLEWQKIDPAIMTNIGGEKQWCRWE